MRYDLVDTPTPSTCRYGSSPLLFRAPARQFVSPFVACLGGSATFGTTASIPYPSALQQASKMPCINLGTRDGGLETILRDPVLLSLASPAEVMILDVGPFWQLSNRLYTVHPRQSSRLSHLGAPLHAIWPQAKTQMWDFVADLRAALPRSLAPTLQDELNIAWEARLRSFLTRRAQPVILLNFDPLFEPIFATLQAEFDKHRFLSFTPPDGDESHEALGALLARTLQELM